MELYCWSEIEEEPLTELLTRRYISGNNITMARMVLKKGCEVPLHSHENEQMSTVLEGALRFVVGEKEVVVRSGETLRIPPYVPHSAEAIEDCDVLDVFAPIRIDWIEGRDGYLRGSQSRQHEV